MSSHSISIPGRNVGGVEQIHADISHLTEVIAHLGELAHLRAEVDRLNQVIVRLTAERDSYQRVALAWAVENVTEEEIQRYAQEEPGLPLEAFIGELERSVQRQ